MIEGFYTRKAGNEGRQVPLTWPDGRESDHWLTVHSVDSDAFRDADVRLRRGLVEMIDMDPEEREQAIKANKIEAVASLISGWSFDLEFTHENLVKFLTEAPQIRDMVDRVAANRAFFLTKESRSSTGTRKRSSS
jgi:hypothetical protein